MALPTRSGDAKAVDGMSFAVDAGEVLGIAGESGSGKTMTALSLFGLLPHGARVTGSIRLDGTELTCLSGKQLRGRPRPADRDGVPGPVHLAAPDPADRHPADRAHAAPPGMSKDEALSGRPGCWRPCASRTRSRRCARTRASSPAACASASRSRSRWPAEPRLLVADEPTTALDVTVQAGILRLLDRLCRERGMAVIVITHDLGVMSATARRLCVMYAGRLAEAGPTTELLARPRHPYTRGLLDALPHGRRRVRCVPIAGQPAVARAGARRLRVPPALPIRPPVVRDRQCRIPNGSPSSTCSPARPTR